MLISAVTGLVFGAGFGLAVTNFGFQWFTGKRNWQLAFDRSYFQWGALATVLAGAAVVDHLLGGPKA